MLSGDPIEDYAPAESPTPALPKKDGKISALEIRSLALEEQLIKWPNDKFILFVMDNPLMRRGYVVESVEFEGGDGMGGKRVVAWRDGDIILSFPFRYNWELINRELVTTAEFDIEKYIEKHAKKSDKVKTGQYL